MSAHPLSLPARPAGPALAAPGSPPAGAAASAAATQAEAGTAVQANIGIALSLQAIVLQHADSVRASTAFASEMASAFSCGRVTVGFVQRGFTRLAAVSNGSDETLVGEVFDPIVAAMDEAVEQGASVHVPMHSEPGGANPRAGSVIRLAHGRLLQRQGGAVASIPIVHLDEVVGAVTFEWAHRPPGFELVVDALEHIVSLIGPVLHLMHSGEAPWHERALAALRRAWQRLRAPEAQRTRFIAGGAALLLLGVLAVPLEYRVGGHARIEGEQQRAIVAPADGYLKVAHVRPGDRVKQGQLMVEMADQDLSLERRKWTSELGQQESAYATALTKSDRSAMVIAQSRADEARAHLGLIEAELARSRIVAPFDGVVIQGDLSQNLGSPVERGKTLMLLAPGEKYRVVVDVDERDIGAVRVGQTGSLALSALPWDTLPITVSRVTPIAKAVDGNNVFEVETEVAAGAQPMRPGLEGVAKIGVGRRPLAWAWFHRVADWARMTLWAWWP